MTEYLKNLKIMKYLNAYKIELFLILLFSLLFLSCEENPEVQIQEEILPETFKVEIPQSISNDNVPINGRSASFAGDTLSGEDIYHGLNTFIHVGENASRIVENLIKSIRRFHINKPFFLTFQSDDDNRFKNLEVLKDVEFEGKIWEFILTITDADSEGNDDGGIALQLFWNRRPVQGIAIFKPFNNDRVHDGNAGVAMFRIDYSKAGELGYDEHMIVGISSLSLANPNDDPFSVRTLRMFVGKDGDEIDLFGNSHHPNARFISDAKGFNWAFVAAGNERIDIAVAEVGLPPSNLDEDDREILLGEFSIKNVFTKQIMNHFPNINPERLEAYLINTEAPGFFDNQGFINGGTSPGPQWDPLVERIQLLAPFNPLETSTLQIKFKR